MTVILVSILGVGVAVVVLGALAFFATDHRDEAQDRQGEFEAAASLQYGRDYQYLGLNVKRRDAYRLQGLSQGATKNVYFVRLPNGTIYTQGSHHPLKFVKLDYVTKPGWSVLMLQGKRLYQYRIQLDAATYQWLLLNWV